MSREATSEQSSVRGGASYYEVFPLGHEPEEGFSWSSERETSAQPSDKEMESYGGKDEVVSEGEKEDDEKEGRESDGNESDGDDEVIESTLRSPGDDHPFILPEEWTVNDIVPMMSNKVFKTLRAVSKFRTTSQSVSLESLRSVIQGRLRMSACMTPCLRQD